LRSFVLLRALRARGKEGGCKEITSGVVEGASRSSRGNSRSVSAGTCHASCSRRVQALNRSPPPLPTAYSPPHALATHVPLSLIYARRIAWRRVLRSLPSTCWGSELDGLRRSSDGLSRKRMRVWSCGRGALLRRSASRRCLDGRSNFPHNLRPCFGITLVLRVGGRVLVRSRGWWVRRIRRVRRVWRIRLRGVGVRRRVCLPGRTCKRRGQHMHSVI
jgi:hypothetical protein